MAAVRQTPEWRLSAFVMIVGEAVLVIVMILSHQHHQPTAMWVGLILFLLSARGFFVVPPNESQVLTFFGRYVGTASTSGRHWSNPFTVRRQISRRVRNSRLRSSK